jgi:hypothetical protein
MALYGCFLWAYEHRWALLMGAAMVVVVWVLVRFE